MSELPVNIREMSTIPMEVVDEIMATLGLNPKKTVRLTIEAGYLTTKELDDKGRMVVTEWKIDPLRRQA